MDFNKNSNSFELFLLAFLVWPLKDICLEGYLWKYPRIACIIRIIILWGSEHINALEFTGILVASYWICDNPTNQPTRISSHFYWKCVDIFYLIVATPIIIINHHQNGLHNWLQYLFVFCSSPSSWSYCFVIKPQLLLMRLVYKSLEYLWRFEGYPNKFRKYFANILQIEQLMQVRRSPNYCIDFLLVWLFINYFPSKWFESLLISWK